MSRFRLIPTPDQEVSLVEHCRHARYVWNLAVEQHRHWRRGFSPAPNYNRQARQLTEARAEHAWLRAGSVTVQQQALRDFAQAMANYFAGTHRRPTWRKAGVHEGFRQVGVQAHHVERLNRRHGRVWIPKVGLNRGILAAGWGMLVARLEHKAPGRVEKINPAYTSQTCSACGYCAPDNRKSQTVFRCGACGHTDNADVNAARNIAAGRAVTAHGDLQSLDGSVKCEAAAHPPVAPHPVAVSGEEIPAAHGEEHVNCPALRCESAVTA